MKKYLILGLILLTTIISAKPSIGFINISFKSSSLRGDAENFSETLFLALNVLEDKYKIIRSSMDLDELTMAVSCVEQNSNCMGKVAKLMKVDYLIYGSLVEENNAYYLNLTKIDVKRQKALSGDKILMKKGSDTYIKVINDFILKVFPETKMDIEALSIPEVLNVTVQSGVTAEFYLDGKLIGNTPISLKSDKVVTGKHTIMLKAKGYDTFKREINITPSAQIMALTMIKVVNPANKKENKFVKKDDNKLDLSTKTVWYKDWRVQAGVGAVVVVVAVVAVVLLTGGDDSPENNVIITW